MVAGHRLASSIIAFSFTPDRIFLFYTVHVFTSLYCEAILSSYKLYRSRRRYNKKATFIGNIFLAYFCTLKFVPWNPITLMTSLYFLVSNPRNGMVVQACFPCAQVDGSMIDREKTVSTFCPCWSAGWMLS